MEIKELLESLTKVSEIEKCEILIIEDGSDQDCKEIVKENGRALNLKYFYKPNSGPGDSRNYGMKRANSDYFVILDSDAILPKDYLINLKNYQKNNYVDCYGGPDKAHENFSDVQKAIDYSMTSLWTTGGIRGRKEGRKGFQPRSFNMGISKKAFKASGGFSHIHPGEDPDLALRLKKQNFKIDLYEDCYVYHKRRISWKSFSLQMKKFGLVRPILNSWHPESHKLSFYFPSFFSLGLLLSATLLIIGYFSLSMIYLLYFLIIFIDCMFKTKNINVSILVLYAVIIQFFSYGIAYLISTYNIIFLKQDPMKTYPNLFFTK